MLLSIAKNAAKTQFIYSCVSRIFSLSNICWNFKKVLLFLHCWMHNNSTHRVRTILYPGNFAVPELAHKWEDKGKFHIKNPNKNFYLLTDCCKMVQYVTIQLHFCIWTINTCNALHCALCKVRMTIYMCKGNKQMFFELLCMSALFQKSDFRRTSL